MRIIAGSCRGRRLHTLKGNNTRPTADRVKEALFSVLAPYLPGARVLDAFAGSGALGLGSEKWHMIRTILLPCASSGIITGVILAIGRIVGESAALLFTAGSGYLLPRSVFSKIFESGGTLTIELYLSMSKGEYDIAFGIAAVLVIIVLLINFLTHAVTKKNDITRRMNNG